MSKATPSPLELSADDSKRYNRLKEAYKKSVNAIFDSVPASAFSAALPRELQLECQQQIMEAYATMRNSLEHHLHDEFSQIFTTKIRRKLNFLDMLVQAEDGGFMYVTAVLFVCANIALY